MAVQVTDYGKSFTFQLLHVFDWYYGVIIIVLYIVVILVIYLSK